jgi:sortase A
MVRLARRLAEVPFRRMARAGKIVRPVLRFVASVLITSGILMLVDAGLTVVWQEPVSAFIAAREQGALEDELDDAGDVLAPVRAATVDEKDVRKRMRRLAAAWRRHVDEGDAVGRIELPSLDRDYAVVQGTKLTTLRKGPGHYPKTPMPGEGGTIGVAGHRTTYGAPFRTIDKLDAGDEIVMDMPYGKLTYRVEKTQIVPPDALWIIDRVPGKERIVLSACHPLYSASQRIVAFARLQSQTLG